jgi:hypothetical protein
MIEKNIPVILSTNITDTHSLEEFTPNIENEGLEENVQSENIIQDIKGIIKNYKIFVIINDDSNLEEEEEEDKTKIEEKESRQNNINDEKETSFPSQMTNIINDININLEGDNEELKEINDINLNIDTLELINLKNQTSSIMRYKKAKEKAKQAKKEMMIAYLEAKNIKKTYMLNDLEDSDSDNSYESELDLEDEEYLNNE